MGEPCLLQCYVMIAKTLSIYLLSGRHKYRAQHEVNMQWLSGQRVDTRCIILVVCNTRNQPPRNWECRAIDLAKTNQLGGYAPPAL